MKKIIKLLPVVLALMMLLAFGALATETDETPDGEQNVTEIVLPEAPTGISSLTLPEFCFVEIIWSEVENADGYDVYFKEKGNWVFKKSTNKEQINFNGLLFNSKFEVGIKSYIEVDGVKYHSEEYSEYVITTGSIIPRVGILSDSKSVKDGIKVSWEKCDGVSGYRLYVRKDGKWVKVKDIYGKDNTEYIYTDVVDGTKYRFGIKAFAKGTEGLKFGPLETKYLTYEDVTRVKNISSSVTASSVTLKWGKVEDARGYRIYMYQGGKWKALKTTTKTSYTVTGLEASKKYILRVRAYEKVNGATKWFPYSKNYSAVTGSKTVDAYRIKNLQKSFSDGDWYIKLKNIGDGNGGKCTVTLAGKGDNLFCKYDYGNGLEIKYLYLDSKERLYAISDADKEYVIVPEDEAEYMVELMYAMSELLKVQNVGKVTAKTAYYNGKTAVAETYKDTKYGFKKTYYFVNDKVVGALFEYDSIEDSYSSFSVKDTPASYLFKVPSGYKKVSW